MEKLLENIGRFNDAQISKFIRREERYKERSVTHEDFDWGILEKEFYELWDHLNEEVRELGAEIDQLREGERNYEFVKDEAVDVANLSFLIYQAIHQIAGD